MNIHTLFPTPVGKENLGLVDQIELETLLEYKKDTVRNIGNSHSRETYLLNNPNLKNLKFKLQDKLREYFFKIHQSYTAMPYITQSWINFNEKGQYHHPHRHANSIISGVYYIKTVNNDKIHFYKEPLPVFEFSDTITDYNSLSWWFSVEDGDLLLFPSTLKHEVTQNLSDTTRISISFNCFVNGTIGKDVNLTELKI